MNNKFCFCGNKIPYEYDPPTKCPKCGVNFADAFRKKVSEQVVKNDVLPKTKNNTSEILDDDDEYEIIKVKKKKKFQAEAKTAKELEEEEFDDSSYNNREEAKEMSRELAASLDSQDFLAQIEDRSVENFKDIYQQKLKNSENQK